MKDAPIGLLDSGSGGLSIWKEATMLLPRESTVYVGDHGHMPYSNKPTSTIRKRVIAIIQFLLQKNVKCIVVACNTATVAGVDVYRKTFPSIPIVGVVPVVKIAASVSKKRKIAVFSTQYTTHSAYQKNLIDQFARECVIIQIGSTNVVSFIEQGDLTNRDLGSELRWKLRSLQGFGVDVLVLGCTHFPFIQDQIRAIVGGDVTILDSGGAVARQVKRILEHESALASTPYPVHQFYTTGDNKKVQRVASALLKQKIHVAYANI